MGDVARKVDHELRDGGQFRSHVLEHFGEGGDNEPQHSRHGAHGKTDQDDGVHEGPFHLAGSSPRVGDLLVQLAEDHGHLPGDFPGANDFHPMMLENVGEIGHRAMHRTARRHARGYLLQHASQLDALGLLGADLEGLHVGDEKVFRPHRESLEIGVGTFDAFTEVELLHIEGIDGETACLGWVLHHGYTGALPAGCKVRGLRVRCGNIQVGDDRMFEELFPEPRFNGWSVGELHVIDPRMIPNGRRDHFEQNVHFHNLLTHLTPVAREITRRCRTSSVQRKWSRDFELKEISIREKAAIIKQGAIGRNDRYRLTEEIRAGLAFLDEIITKGMLPADFAAGLKKRREKLERDVSKILQAPVRPACP